MLQQQKGIKKMMRYCTKKREIETDKGRQGYWNLILVKLNLVNSIWEEGPGLWNAEPRNQNPETGDF